MFALYFELVIEGYAYMMMLWWCAVFIKSYITVELHLTTATTASPTLFWFVVQVTGQSGVSVLLKCIRKTCGVLKWKSMFFRSCVIHRRWKGAAEKIHQPLLPTGQDVSSPSVAQPCGHPAGLFLWSALHGGRAQCEWVCVCVKRQLRWAALSLGWQSPLSSNPLDPLPFHSEP